MLRLYKEGKNVPFLKHCMQLDTRAFISLNPASNKVTYDSFDPVESLSSSDLGSIKTHISYMKTLGVKDIEIKLSDDKAVLPMIKWFKKQFKTSDVHWAICGTNLSSDAFAAVKDVKNVSFEECFIPPLKSKFSYSPANNGIVYINEQNADWETCEADNEIPYNTFRYADVDADQSLFLSLVQTELTFKIQEPSTWSPGINVIPAPKFIVQPKATIPQKAVAPPKLMARKGKHQRHK